MKKAMISQPMRGLSDEEILKVRNEAKYILEKNGYTVVDTIFDFNDEELKEEGITNIPLYYLSKSLEEMSKCDALYVCKGWRNTRGCVIEVQAAVDYGLEVIYQPL